MIVFSNLMVAGAVLLSLVARVAVNATVSPPSGLGFSGYPGGGRSPLELEDKASKSTHQILDMVEEGLRIDCWARNQLKVLRKLPLFL